MEPKKYSSRTIVNQLKKCNTTIKKVKHLLNVIEKIKSDHESFALEQISVMEDSNKSKVRIKYKERSIWLAQELRINTMYKRFINLVNPLRDAQIASLESLNIEEAALVLGVSKNTLYRREYREAKQIPFHRLGEKLVFFYNELTDYLKQNKQKNAIDILTEAATKNVTK